MNLKSVNYEAFFIFRRSVLEGVALRNGLFCSPIKPISWHDIGFIAGRNGLFCKAKWALLQSIGRRMKVRISVTSMIISTLRKPLKTRVFASKRALAHKYSILTQLSISRVA